ncbi:hypothetical protein M5689_002252 [Euphorbia peplus]|nr:hypothetical protein M5689_002252 [Euphorbia peplus]
MEKNKVLITITILLFACINIGEAIQWPWQESKASSDQLDAECFSECYDSCITAASPRELCKKGCQPFCRGNRKGSSFFGYRESFHKATTSNGKIAPSPLVDDDVANRQKFANPESKSFKSKGETNSLSINTRKVQGE